MVLCLISVQHLLKFFQIHQYTPWLCTFLRTDYPGFLQLIHNPCRTVKSDFKHPLQHTDGAFFFFYDKLSGIGKKISDYPKLAEELGVGELTLKDIVKELEKPARDPREDMPKPILRSDVLEIKDLKPGMILKGTVRNVIDFGAFVDIGVHQDGLVHISQICDRYIKHPLEAVSVGDIVDVQVMSVDVKKQRIQLTMKFQK